MRVHCPHPFRTALLTATLLVTPLLARADDATSTKVGSAQAANAAEASTRPPSLRIGDAQIFAILNAANTGEIDAGNLARQKTGNEEVRNFAAMMVKGHTALNDQGASLASQLGITPADSADSQKLTDENAAGMKKLQSLDGAAFDKAYVTSQVKGHKRVLRLIDRTLLPSAKAPEVRAMLKKARPIVAMHLRHARHLQAELMKGTRTTENP